MTVEKKRILSIDILRGLIMVIMALDHTRDFFHLGGMGSNPMDAETTYPFLFFTRWITHFCAPTFLFLSGISAYLSARNKDPQKAGNFLIKRGLWLIVVEILIVSFALTFNPFYNLVFLTVIWAIGWSMIVLGILSRISHKLVFAVGLILFFGHNLLNYVDLPAPGTLPGGIIGALFTARAVVLPVTPDHIFIAGYAILPWTGVMLLGFSAGKWYNADFNPVKRKQLLFYAGLSLFLLFLVLRYFGWYGNPSLRQEYPDLERSIYSFLDVSKYPPSLQFYGMTLGISLMFLSWTENVQNWCTRILMVYGRVPFFYYVLHLYLLHIIVVIVFFLSGFGIKDIQNPDIPFLFVPKTFGFSLPVVYIFWLSVVCILYLPCRWFQKYKATHSHWWLSYLSWRM